MGGPNPLSLGTRKDWDSGEDVQWNWGEIPSLSVLEFSKKDETQMPSSVWAIKSISLSFFFFFLTQIISSLSQSHALKFISLCPLSFATVHSRHLRVLYDFTLNPLPYASPTFSSLLALCLIHTLWEIPVLLNFTRIWGIAS